MSAVDFEAQMSVLESEWRHGYEACIIARAEYQALAADREANFGLLESARKRLDLAEALKSGVMAKIQRFEDRLSSFD